MKLETSNVRNIWSANTSCRKLCQIRQKVSCIFERRFLANVPLPSAYETDDIFTFKRRVRVLLPCGRWRKTKKKRSILRDFGPRSDISFAAFLRTVRRYCWSFFFFSIFHRLVCFRDRRDDTVGAICARPAVGTGTGSDAWRQNGAAANASVARGQTAAFDGKRGRSIKARRSWPLSLAVGRTRVTSRRRGDRRATWRRDRVFIRWNYREIHY